MKYEIPNPALSEVEVTFYNFVPLHTGVYPRCKLTCFPVGGPFEPVHQPAKRPGIRKPRKRNSTKDYVRIYKLFMQNKPNLRDDKMNISLDMTTIYMNFPADSGQKTKPIQTQFNPIQSQFKPNLSRRSLDRSRIKPNFASNYSSDDFDD